MTPVQSINAFYQAIMDKRVEGICAAYIQSDTTYVVLEGPRFTTLGYENIARGWRDFCASALDLTQIEWVEGPFEDVTEHMAMVAGQIILSVRLKQNEFTVRFRATFVLKPYQSVGWRTRHEHVSGPLADPYGMGDWLKT